jgi:hypothetical protein
VSQPWREPSRPTGPQGPGRPGLAPGQTNAWAAGELDLAQTDPPWNAGDEDDQAVPDWTPQPGPAAQSAEQPEQSSGEHSGLRLTGRGAIAGMLVLFFLGLLLSTWLHWGVLAGGSFLIGSVAAARYTRQPHLLAVVVTPPLLFFCDLVCVKALTSTGNALLSTVEGTALTLASAAPWLFAGVAGSLIVAWFRGLPRCVSDLRRDLHPGTRGGRAADAAGR